MSSALVPTHRLAQLRARVRDTVAGLHIMREDTGRCGVGSPVGKFLVPGKGGGRVVLAVQVVILKHGVSIA